MNIKVDFDNIVVKEDKNDFNVKVLMLKGEKGDQGDGEPNVIEKVQVNGTDLTITNKTVNVPVPVVDSSISSSSTNPVQNSAIYNALSDKVDTSALNNYYETSEIDDFLGDKADVIVVDKKSYYFDNVASMKAYNLKNGDYVITKGYYSANDGGHGEYIILSDNSLVEDNALIHNLNNGLKAKLIITSNEISSVLLGENNNNNILQTIFDLSSELNVKVKLIKNKSYTITNSLIIRGNTNIDFNNATLQLGDNSNCIGITNTDVDDTIFNITLSNLNYDGNSENNYTTNNSGKAILLHNVEGLNIINCNFEDCERNPIDLFECSNVKIENVNFKDIALRNSEYISHGNYCIAMENRSNKTKKGKYVTINNITVDNYQSGVFHTYNYDYVNFNNIECKNPVLETTYLTLPFTITNTHYVTCNNINIPEANKGIEINANSSNIEINNSKIDDCATPILFGNNNVANNTNTNIIFNNCVINSNSTFAFLYNYSDNVKFNNCYISGSFGGNQSMSNLIISNSTITNFDVTRFSCRSACIISNSKLNNMYIYTLKTNIQRLFAEFSMEASGTYDFDMSFMGGRCDRNLRLVSAFASNDSQYYRGEYTYTLTENTSITGDLSDVFNETGTKSGDNYIRKITPSITTRKHITITNNSNVALNCKLELY